MVLNFGQCRVADASAIAALDATIRDYQKLGITLHLKYLSADARHLLLQTSAASKAAAIYADESDPVYDVAASTPDDIPTRPEELMVNKDPRQEIVVVKPTKGSA